MFCPECNSYMKNVMHFELNNQYQYSKCTRCYKRTKNKRLLTEKLFIEKQETQLNNTCKNAKERR